MKTNDFSNFLFSGILSTAQHVPSLPTLFPLYLPPLIYPSVLVVLSFRSLELVRARDRQVLAAEEERAKTQKKQLKLERDNEREMATRERGHLVALIGNVAHDLKTPLHSFKMDIDFLRTTLVNIFMAAKLPMSPEDPTQLPDDVESLLGSLGGSTGRG